MRKTRLAHALMALTLSGLAAACGDGPFGNDDGREIRAAGRIFTLSGDVPAELRVFIDDAGSRTSADIADDGTFSLTTSASSDTVDIIIDAASPASRTMHPALIRHVVGAPLPDLRFVMVPLSWTIASGTHAGRSIDISVDAAFLPPCTTAGDTNCDGFYPTVWNDGFRIWPATAYPIRLVFDRERTSAGVTITAQDSSALWNVVERMNDDYGFELFRPAQASEVTFQSDGRPNDAVSVRIDTSLSGFAAWTNWYWNGSGDMYSGVIRPRSLQTLSYTGVMTHELLHTQGFKHSCSWSTVMGGYGCSNVGALSPSDVAYAQLARAVAERQEATGAPHGLVAARNGQRVLLGDMPPIPVRSSFMAMLRGGDSIGEPTGDHAGH